MTQNNVILNTWISVEYQTADDLDNKNLHRLKQ